MTRTLFKKVLVANRGEVALRIVRALRELGVASVAVHADDDAHAPHVRAADAAVGLGVAGPAAYLDGVRLIAIAREHGCDAVHPGYGFLSERADFASACAAAGLRFIGPTVEQLALFGDKARSRALAQRCDVPVMPGSQQAVTLDEALAFFAAQRGAGVMVKAIGGGGGRGMRAVASAEDLPAAYERCRSEAKAAFGVDGVYVERLMTGARHIEIQVVGDGDAVLSLGERECTLQRRFQKLVEIAPSPSLSDALRQRIVADALRMAREVRYEGLGTFEFLVDQASADLPYVFIEANPRLQVEHTITEEVTGVDLVQTQIAIAAGCRLSDLGLDARTPPAPRGFAIQWRINAETLDEHGPAWQRHADALRSAGRAGHPRRYARRRRRRAVAALRHAAREARHPYARRVVRRCVAPLAARACRIPDLGRGDEPAVAARARRGSGDGEPERPYALARGRAAGARRRGARLRGPYGRARPWAGRRRVGRPSGRA
jgi:acetyl/propionyl-CoA carboxylase alpha subunit